MVGPERTNTIEREILKRGKGLQARMTLEDTFYIEENPGISELVAPLKFLFPFDNRVKCGSEGSIWILSFPPILKPTEDMFQDLPLTRKPKNVAQRRWSNPDDIETSIRMAEHVADAYKPQEGEVVQNTLSVVDRIKELAYEYQKPGIHETDRENLAKGTADVLVVTKFNNARKPEKTKIKNMLLSAGQRDSIQRINPSRSRIIISNAWIDLSRELIVNRTIGEKYRTMGWRLRQERDFERFCLEQTVGRVEELNNLRENSQEAKKILKELQLFIYRYNSSDYIKAKPYSKAAAISRFLIFGDGQKPAVDENGEVVKGELNKDLKSLAKYIGLDNAMMFWGTPSYRSLDTIGKKIKRLENVSYILTESLLEGDINLTNEKT